MAMEAHKLRFVRCPRCHQLLVEYPSIPVYKCGGCGTVLRAKNRVVPVAQTGSESEEHTSFPSSLKGSPQNSKLASSGEQQIADQPHGPVADVTISSAINNTNSCVGTNQETTMSVAESVTLSERQEEDTCSLVDGNIQNPEVKVKEIHDRDTSSSDFMEKVENLDTSEDANEGKVDNFGTSEVSTLHEKTWVVQTEERMNTYEGMHIESHEFLIEELERSLSFSSDDEDFSVEAENSGLSDALRHQMGSRRFMLGGKMNDASRSDPHGRLIEELEMSFSDSEEPMEQHASVADRLHGNEHDEHPQSLVAESAHPCEEGISSFDKEHLKSEQTFHRENMLIDNGNKGKEECHIEDDSIANCIHGNEHIVVAKENTTERFYENENCKDCQSVHAENAHPCEGSISSFNDGNIKFKQSSQQDDLTDVDTAKKEEGCIEDDNMANCVHGNENIVYADEDIAGRVHGNEELTADGTGENEESHGNENLLYADEDIAGRVHGNEELTAGGTGENEESHGNENLIYADENIAGRVHGNEALTVDGIWENGDSLMEDDNTSNYVHGNENVSVANEDIADKVHEHGKDRQSLEAESANLCDRSISSLNTGHIKSEQNSQQKDLTADGTKEKKEGFIEDDNTTNCIQADCASVANFSSLSNKRTQCKLPSFNKNKGEMPYRYRASQHHQGLSLDSEDFRSIQNFIESQIDGTSSSLSSGSPSQGDSMHRTSNKFNNIVRCERLKKMDELRDQLSRLSSQKGSEKRCQKRGLEYHQQPNSYDVEQHLHSVDADSIPSSCALESYYGHGRPPRYNPPNSFPPTHTYTHCHFGQGQTHMPHNYDAWEFNSYYQSTYAESTILDHESLKSSFKEQKRVVRKHILRPLSGASPFTICNGCFNLVQMPSDIYISKAKIGKMQCGKCSRVLALSFAAVHNADAKINVDVAQQSYNPDDSIVDKNEDIAAYYAECLTGNPVSINEEYGASLTRSLSTQAGSSLAATKSGKKVSDSALHRLMGYDSASQLLRHSRVLEDGYDNFESMMPVSSRVSRRKNT